MFEQTQTIQVTNTRVAWLIPSLKGGNYWHPILSEFRKFFPQSIVYTAQWSGYARGFEDAFTVKVVGEHKLIKAASAKGYDRHFIRLSPKIIIHLFQLKPSIIFANGFSMWTLLALIFKPLGKWRVAIAYEGSTPNIDCQDSAFRSFFRRLMVGLADALITNTQAGKLYLTKVLEAQPSQVFARPYEVPIAKALLQQSQDAELEELQSLSKPIFLFVGQLIPRKGLTSLLKACTILKATGKENYTLLIIGEGEQREELEAFSQGQGLPVKWMGWIDYGALGDYFRQADIFVLPTIEDTWGMVVLEAMAFGKPILCSQGAGASEMVIDGENGYLFEPDNAEELATAMCRFIDGGCQLITAMESRSQELIAQHNPETAAAFLAQVTFFTCDRTTVEHS